MDEEGEGGLPDTVLRPIILSPEDGLKPVGSLDTATSNCNRY